MKQSTYSASLFDLRLVALAKVKQLALSYTQIYLIIETKNTN